jgi:hypothetical protein
VRTQLGVIASAERKGEEQKRPGTAHPVARSYAAGQARLGGELRFFAIISVLALLVTGVALGAIKERTPKDEAPQLTEVRTTQKEAILPKLVLPNIKLLVKKAWEVDRKILPKQRWKSAAVLAFFNGRGKWLRATRHEKCWEVPWQRSCTIARASYRLHSALAEVATRRLLYELPVTNDWLTALRIAQRAYPGTYDQVYRISDREGGFGRWVWYSGACSNPPCLWRGYHVGGDNVSGADTVGGWVQFRWSTFAPYWRQAKADLERRGFIIPPMKMPPEGGPTKFVAWLSPLGQALTASYMHYYGKQGCHWC